MEFEKYAIGDCDTQSGVGMWAGPYDHVNECLSHFGRSSNSRIFGFLESGSVGSVELYVWSVEAIEWVPVENVDIHYTRLSAVLKLRKAALCLEEMIMDTNISITAPSVDLMVQNQPYGLHAVIRIGGGG